MAFAQELPVLIQLGNGVSLELVYVSAGEFEQGSDESEKGYKPDESMRHVKLSHNFLLGKFPVTVGQFKRFVAATNYKTEAERGTSGGFGFDGKELVQRPDFNWKTPGFPIADDHSVCLVTIEDAKTFLDWLSRVGNRKYVLPTEAQWEFACRAKTQTRFSSGNLDADLDNIGWYQGNAGNGTHPVGKKAPNAFGLYDMSGNVFQWCSDIYATYQPGIVQDPWQIVPDEGDKNRNVLRGGSWLRRADSCRSAARYRNDPHSRNADNGFRVCCLVQSEMNTADFQGADFRNLDTAPSTPAVLPTDAGPPTQNVPIQPKIAGNGTSTNILFLILSGLLCLLPLFLLIAVAIAVLRASSARSQDPDGNYRSDSSDRNRQKGQLMGMASNLSSERAETLADGFWLNTKGYAIGSTVNFRCLVNGQSMQQSVVVQTEPKQFVYTGSVPENLIILNVTDPNQHPRRTSPTMNRNEVDDILPPDNILPSDNILPPDYHGPKTGQPPSSKPFEGYPPAY